MDFFIEQLNNLKKSIPLKDNKRNFNNIINFKNQSILYIDHILSEKDLISIDIINKFIINYIPKIGLFNINTNILNANLFIWSSMLLSIIISHDYTDLKNSSNEEKFERVFKHIYEIKDTLSFQSDILQKVLNFKYN